MRKRKVAAERAQRNRKPATTSKRSQRPKVAARAQHKRQALIKSRKDSAAASSSEEPAEIYQEPKAETSVADNRARAAALETVLQTSLQNEFSPKMRDNAPRLDVFLPFSNMQAYQAKFLEVTQANTQFAFEFILRLARIRSPFEFWAVITEFTARRIMTIGKESKELATFWRADAIRNPF